MNLLSSRKQPTYELASKYHPAFYIRNFLPATLLNELNKVLSNLLNPDTKKFNFPNQLNKDRKLRICIPWKKIEKEIPGYKQIIKSALISIPNTESLVKKSFSCLSKLINLEKSILIDSSKGYKLACRVRHFIDLKGFYLSPHVDSIDTLFALIMPISTGSTTTLFTELPFTGSIQSNKIEEYFPSQFIENCFIGITEQKNIIQMRIEEASKARNIGSTYKSHRSTKIFYAYQTPMKCGDALIIPNPMCMCLNYENNFKVHLKKTYKHGVFPPIPEANRPILLADFILLSEGFNISSEDYQRCKAGTLMPSTNEEYVVILGDLETFIL